MTLDANRAGTTLVELAIFVALLAVVSGSAAHALLTGGRAIRTGSMQVEVEQRAGRALARIDQELSFADASSLTGFPASPLFDTGLTYSVVDSIDETTGSVAWINNRIELQLAPGEVNDGLDNNGDGHADEGRVVLLRRFGTADEQTVVLCDGVREYLGGETADGTDENGNGWIDERGLSLARVGNCLVVRLTLERLDGDDIPARCTVTATLRLKN